MDADREIFRDVDRNMEMGIASLQVIMENGATETAADKVMGMEINVIKTVSEINFQCRLVNNTDFDSAQSDGHPERSRRVFASNFY